MATSFTKNNLKSKKHRSKRSWKKLERYLTIKSNLGLSFVKRIKKRKMISINSYLIKLALTSNLRKRSSKL